MSTQTNRKNLTEYQFYEGLLDDIDSGRDKQVQERIDLITLVNLKQRGMTPLFLACIRKNIVIVNYLLAQGADPNTKCFGRPPLWQSVLLFEMDIIEALLEHGADPNLCYKDISPLQVAASKGLIEVCRLLLFNGADVNYVSPTRGTAVNIAVSKNHQFVFSELVKYDVDYSLTNDTGETLLHIACKQGNEELAVKILKSGRIDYHKKEITEGNTALHYAFQYSHYKLAKNFALRDMFLTLELNTLGFSPLFYTPRRIRIPIMDSILSNIHSNLIKALDQKDTLDLTFKVNYNGELSEVKCHSAMVWIRCPALRSLLKVEMVFPIHNEIEVTKYCPSVIKSFVQFLYSDILDCKKIYLKEMLSLSKEYQMERLELLTSFQLGKPVSVPLQTLDIDMEKLFNNPIFSDISIQSDNQTFYCHRFVLFCSSQYFLVMLNSQLMESTSRTVSIDDVGFSFIRDTLKWMYTHTLNKSDTNELLEILELSNRFFMRDLSLMTQILLCKKVNEQTLFPLLITGDMYHLPLLKEEGLHFLMRNPDLVHTSDFINLPKDTKDYCMKVV